MAASIVIGNYPAMATAMGAAMVSAILVARITPAWLL